MPLGVYRESLELQEKGAPCVTEGGTFFVRRSGTEEYWKARREIAARLFGIYLQPKPENETAILANMLAEYMVTGWEGVYSDDGEGDQLEYSKEAARAIFLNKEYFLSLNKILEEFSWNFAGYLRLQAEEDLDVLKKK